MSTWELVLAEIESKPRRRLDRKYFKDSGYSKEEYRDAVNHYWAQEREDMERIKKAMLRDVGLEGHPKAEKAWLYAYQEAHSGGYGEVYFVLCDLADLML